MIQSLKYIRTIAAAERSILFRTPKVWVLGSIGGLFTFLLLLGTTLASIFDNTPEGEFMLEGTDAWIALYLFSYAQAIIIIFVAADFRKAETQAHLDQVMLSRPMTTANWVLGKYMGIVSGLLMINLFFLGLSAIGRLVKMYVLDVNFNMMPAAQYFLIATIPSILFMTALVFFLISLVRVQAVAILIPLAYVAAILFYVRDEYEGLFDYACFAIPLFNSDLIGFGEIESVLWQRAFYLLLSAALICGTILLYPRLHQSTVSRRITGTTGILTLTGAVLVVSSIWMQYAAQQDVRNEMRAHHVGRASAALPTVTHYDLDISLDPGPNPIAIEAQLTVHNPHSTPIDTLLFSLNSGLSVTRATWADRSVPMIHEKHLIRIPLPAPLGVGMTDSLSLSYTGDISGEYFAIERLDEAEGLIRKSGDGPWTKDNISAWVDKRVAVLPAQSGWYPVPGVASGYPYDNPKPANFSTATIIVETPGDVYAIAQGARVSEVSEGGRRTTRFQAETPVPTLSLNAGPYERLSRKFAQTEVELYFYPGHLMGYEAFDDVADTCYQAVERLFELFEQAAGTPYPYPKLSFVEVPLQMQVYTTLHGVDNVLLQPGVVMIEELQLAGKRLDKTIESSIRNAQRKGRDDTEWRIKRDVFVKTVLDVLMPTRDQLDGSLSTPLRNYYHFRVDLASPLLSRALELQLHEEAERLTYDTFFPDRFNQRLSSNERMRQNNQEWSVRRRYGIEIDTVLATLEMTPLKELRPEGDGRKYRAVLDFKGAPVLDMLEDWADEGAYRQALNSLLTDHLYQRVTLDGFLDMVQTFSEADVASFVDQWFNKATFPGYQITRPEVEKWDTGEMQVAYRTRFNVRNGESGDGFVRVVMKTRRDRVLRSLSLRSYEEKEVHMVTSDVPENVQIVPFFARNRGNIMRPVSMSSGLRKGTPRDTSFTVESTLDSLVFILDDRDEGFFMPSIAEAKYLRPEAQMSSWKYLTRAEAYGRYIFGYRYRWQSDGDFPVRWETNVPRSGDYELSLHMPPRLALQRRFFINVDAADGPHEVMIQPQGTKSEWWPMGKFTFDKDKKAIIELSDAGKGYIIADALRWTFIK